MPRPPAWPTGAGRLRAQKEEGAVAAVKKGLALLDRHLARRTYLVGHAATLADIVGVCNLYHGYTKARPAAPGCCARPCASGLAAACAQSAYGRQQGRLPQQTTL